MQHAPDKKDKLLPLRKFAVPGVYSAAYLSQLVQRKRLKAKQIGRNYYTTTAWFEEYVSLHSRDCKQESYELRQNGASESLKREAAASGTSYIASSFSWQTVAIITAAVFLLLIGQWFFVNRDEGQIAGDSEISTSTNLIKR